MNAKFLENLIKYRSKYDLEFTKTILLKKTTLQMKVVKNRDALPNINNAFIKAQTVQECLLIEARVAKIYWKFFGENISRRVDYSGRSHQSDDVVNKLLNIGYHFLFQKNINLCKELDIVTQVGFFHKAQSKNGNPFIYDFVEWLRPVAVDQVLLAFISKRKIKLMN